jgi:hypothetical protein
MGNASKATQATKGVKPSMCCCAAKVQAKNNEGGKPSPLRPLRGGLWTSLAALWADWRLAHSLTAAPRCYPHLR